MPKITRLTVESTIDRAVFSTCLPRQGRHFFARVVCRSPRQVVNGSGMVSAWQSEFGHLADQRESRER
jgi:hypothetical protein